MNGPLQSRSLSWIEGAAGVDAARAQATTVLIARRCQSLHVGEFPACVRWCLPVVLQRRASPLDCM